MQNNNRKPFKTYDEQIQIFESRWLVKDLTSKQIFRNKKYYSIVNGYKELFLINDGSLIFFLLGCNFNELYAVCYFDREIKALFLKYIIRIELKLRSIIAYEFALIYGDKYLEATSCFYYQTINQLGGMTLDYKIYQPYSYLYHLSDPLGVNFTIITGSEKAILFDTGYGLSDIRKEINKIVKTPYIVINSHGHMDHTNGNYLFEEVYIHPQDIDLCIHNNIPERRSLNIQIAKSQGLVDEMFDKEMYINQGCGNLVTLADNQEFNLGDLHVRVIPMPGHTQGSIGLLIEEERLLLSGDAAISMIWLFLTESTSKDDYIRMLKNVMKEPFDHFITGHISRVFPKEYFEYYIQVAMKSNVMNSKPITFAGFERPNTYQYKELFGDDIIGICFHEE